MMEEINLLCDRVRQTAYDIRAYHGPGYIEKVYTNALIHRLRKSGIEVSRHPLIEVFDEDGTLIGDFEADLLVDQKVLLELKAVKALAPEHEAQILGYLKGSRIKDGLLINFGAYKFEIRKYRWTEREF
jgi:GxxExxY protein